MAQINGAWTELRVTSEGISVSLYTESDDRVSVEDETWFTWDELEDSVGAVVELGANQPSTDTESDEKSYILPNVGDVMVDPKAPRWSDDNLVRVTHVYPEVTHSEWPLTDHDGEADVLSDLNRYEPADAPVVEAEYLGNEGNEYAFPVTRLEHDKF